MVKLKLKKKRNSSAVFMAMILLVFCIMGGVVFSVERRISLEMSKSAIENLSESLELIKGTIQAILLKEAEFQRMLAEEIALMDDPRAFIRSEHINKTMVKLSLVPSGESRSVKRSWIFLPVIRLTGCRFPRRMSTIWAPGHIRSNARS